MSRPDSEWKHPKKKKRIYVGKYERVKKGNKRVLVLSYYDHNSSKDVLIDQEVFESHEKAKEAKWKKLK